MSDGSHRWPHLSNPTSRFVPSGHSIDHEAERKSVLEKARKSGYDAGYEEGLQAAQRETTKHLEQLEGQVVQARAQLQQWQATYRAQFSTHALDLMRALGIEQAALTTEFYASLLDEVALALDVCPDTLVVELSEDLQASMPSDCNGLRVNTALPEGEIRILSGPMVARINLYERARDALLQAESALEAELALNGEAASAEPHDA